MDEMAAAVRAKFSDFFSLGDLDRALQGELQKGVGGTKA